MATTNQERVMHKSFLVNFGLIVVKLIAGFFFRSSALIADGIHSLSDFLSDIFVIIGIRTSTKPPDDEHPFGHGKFEYVVSMMLGFSILFIAYQLIVRTVSSFQEVPSVPRGYGILVALFVIVIKLLLSTYLLKKAAQYDSHVLKASGQESTTDVISSFIVLIGIFLGVLGGRFSIDWLLYADNAAAIIIAIFIIKIGIAIIVEAIENMLGKNAKKSVLNQTREVALSVPGVIKVDRLDMIVYGHYYHVMIEILVRGDITVEAGHDIAGAVKKKLMKNAKITHVLVHVNPEVKS